MKILVTGGSGFLAKRVGDYLEAGPDMQILRPAHAELDITLPENCKRWFDKNRPDAVVQLAAISDIAECAANEELSRNVNARGPVNLAACFKETGGTGRFLYASSDQVYTGNSTPDRLNKETDPLSPRNLYAAEKLEAEEGVSAILPEAVALRLPWMFDLRPGKMNYVKLIAKSILNRQKMSFGINELRAETFALEIAENIRKMLLSDVPGGAYNFGGPAYGNSYETAAEVFELVGEAMQLPADGLAVPVEFDSPRSLAMDQTKINSAGITFRNTVESVKYCLEQEAAAIQNGKIRA